MKNDLIPEDEYKDFPWLTKVALKIPILKEWFIYFYVFSECYTETQGYEVINKGRRKRDIDRTYRYKNPEYEQKLLRDIHKYDEINQNDWLKPYDE